MQHMVLMISSEAPVDETAVGPAAAGSTGPGGGAPPRGLCPVRPGVRRSTGKKSPAGSWPANSCVPNEGRSALGCERAVMHDER
jgi:hypothetical protein